jgi:3-dehydroquinate synthetase
MSWRRVTWKKITNYLGQILTKIKLPALDQNLFHEMILHDKKSQKQSVNFIMLRKLGESFIRKETPIEMLWIEFREFTEKFTELLEIEGK